MQESVFFSVGREALCAEATVQPVVATGTAAGRGVDTRPIARIAKQTFR